MFDFITTEFVNFFRGLAGISKTLWHFLAPLFGKDLAGLLTQIAPLAITAVESLADSTASGPEKFATAFTQIEAEVKAAGIAATTSALNLAIELAVQHLKTPETATPAA